MSVKNSSVYDDIRETSSRILTVPDVGTAATTSLFASAVAAGVGAWITGDVRHVRVTNLDDENGLVLTLVGSSNGTLQLEAGGSIMFTSLSALTAITATGHASDNVDVEVFVASI